MSGDKIDRNNKIISIVALYGGVVVLICFVLCVIAATLMLWRDVL